MTRGDLGQKVYETLSLIFNRYGLPARQAPLAEMLDSKNRYEEAVGFLQELSGANLGTEPSAPSEDSQRRISGIYVLIDDIRRVVTPLMKGKDYEIRIPSKPTKMRNSVSYKHFDVLAFVDSGTKTMVFAINDRNQYIFSDKMYWTAL